MQFRSHRYGRDIDRKRVKLGQVDAQGSSQCYRIGGSVVGERSCSSQSGGGEGEGQKVCCKFEEDDFRANQDLIFAAYENPEGISLSNEGWEERGKQEKVKEFNQEVDQRVKEVESHYSKIKDEFDNALNENYHLNQELNPPKLDPDFESQLNSPDFDLNIDSPVSSDSGFEFSVDTSLGEPPSNPSEELINKRRESLIEQYNKHLGAELNSEMSDDELKNKISDAINAKVEEAEQEAEDLKDEHAEDIEEQEVDPSLFSCGNKEEYDRSLKKYREG